MAPPMYVKGGVWTNVEDQILKAAVSKYGLTQWARVASLLPKKTAKQAKARWNEYLNPSIPLSSWTKQEDEKLLSLIKVLPNQWRSIAPIVGRTATQCVERYQRLIEDASNNEDGISDQDTKNMGMIGPGIESLPALGNAYESLPSRPDGEDMEDEEREMLSEAKARLANTQGKKAKRKDRERMLEESKRIALLQKRRELKAAGINVGLTSKNRSKRREFDYNADIPHERQPFSGLYNVETENEADEEQKTNFEKDVNFKGISVKEVEDKYAKQNKQDSAKEGKRVRNQTRQAAGAVAQLDENLQIKRRKLDLPQPREDVVNGKEISSASNIQASVSAIAHPDKVRNKKSNANANLSNKEVIRQLKSLLANVPQPSKHVQLVLPKFDPNDELLTVEVMLNDKDTDVEQLELLKRVDEESDKLRRSQVVQQGLTVPHPSKLNMFSKNKDALTQEIEKELFALVESDYTQFENSSFGGKILELVDEKIHKDLQQQIDEEIKVLGPRKEISDDVELLKDNDQTMDLVFDLLVALDQNAKSIEDSIENLETFKANGAKYLELLREVDKNYVQLLELDIEAKLISFIDAEEDIALASRSSRLHELVESIKSSENRAFRN